MVSVELSISQSPTLHSSFVRHNRLYTAGSWSFKVADCVGLLSLLFSSLSLLLVITHLLLSAGDIEENPGPISKDAKPTLQDLQYMSYTSEDGRTVHVRLMDRFKPKLSRLAIALGFPHYIIDDLGSQKDPVYYMLSEWLKGGNQEHDQRPLTWRTLITALHHAGLLEEEEILKKHFVAAPLVAESSTLPLSSERRRQHSAETKSHHKGKAHQFTYSVSAHTTSAQVDSAKRKRKEELKLDDSQDPVINAKAATAFFGFDSSAKDYPYRMLLIGEISSGKTSFLNLICNSGMVQVLQHSFDDLSVLKNFNDDKLENTMSHGRESKTSGAKVYSAVLSNLKMQIIDTPGFGDSRGMQKDKLNVQLIIEVLMAEEYINCLCLVINGRMTRMSASLKYFLSEIITILSKKVLGNLIVVFTNTANMSELNFEVDQLNAFLGQKLEDYLMFNIENPYCRLKKVREKQDRQLSVKRHFEETALVLEEMFTVIRNFSRVHTRDFIDLYEKKQAVEKNVVTLLTAYDNQKRIEKAIEDAQNEVKAAWRGKALNDFASVKRIPVVELVATRHHNSLCAAKECASNCHVPCYLEKSMDKSAFLSCAAMEGEYCKECGHHYTHHYHLEQRYEETVKEEQVVDKIMKKKFREASSMEEKARIVYEKLETDKRHSERKRKKLSEELLKLLEEFHKLGMTRKYTKIVESHVAVIDTRLGGAEEEAQDL